MPRLTASSKGLGRSIRTLYSQHPSVKSIRWFRQFLLFLCAEYKKKNSDLDMGAHTPVIFQRFTGRQINGVIQQAPRLYQSSPSTLDTIKQSFKHGTNIAVGVRTRHIGGAP